MPKDVAFVCGTMTMMDTYENPNGVTPGTDCNDSNPDILPVDFDGDGYHSVV